jgi:hypothetical protein
MGDESRVEKRPREVDGSDGEELKRTKTHEEEFDELFLGSLGLLMLLQIAALLAVDGDKLGFQLSKHLGPLTILVLPFNPHM